MYWANDIYFVVIEHLGINIELQVNDKPVIFTYISTFENYHLYQANIDSIIFKDPLCIKGLHPPIYAYVKNDIDYDHLSDLGVKLRDLEEDEFTISVLHPVIMTVYVTEITNFQLA